MGINDFVWWFGVVEDINDPMEVGRIKVRVFGYHNSDSQAVPTESLPWCYQVMPTTSASHNTHGSSPTGLNVGSWVVGWFMDGRKGQFPICFGTIHGIHSSGLSFGGLGDAIAGAGAGSGNVPGGGSSPGGSPPGTPSGPPTGGSYGDPTTPGAQGLVRGQGALPMRELGISAGQWDAYRAGVARIEGARYNQMGGAGNNFAGKYQMGRPAIKDAAGILGESPPSTQQFLSNPNMQERYFSAYTVANHGYMSNNDVYNNLNTNDKLGALGFAHNQGHVPAKNYLNTGVDSTRDAFGTSGTEFQDSVQSNLENIDEFEDESTAQYDDNQTACSSDSVSHRAHSVHFPTWTSCYDDTPMSHQSNDKVQELDLSEVQYMETWQQGGDMALAGTPVPKDVSTYPDQQTWVSPGGKVMMGWDDTPGASRYWTVMPETGNRIEWDDVGNITTHVSGSEMKIKYGNTRDYTKGDNTITSDKNVKIMSQDETSIQSKQGINMSSERGFTLQTNGPLTIAAGGDVTFQGSSIKMMATEGSLDMRSSDEMNIESAGEMNFNAGGSTDSGSEGGVSFDVNGPFTYAATNIIMAADSKIKMEAPDMSLAGPNIKLDTVTIEKGFSKILNWDKTVSSSKFSKYADESILAKNPGGDAQESDQQDGESEAQDRLDSAGQWDGSKWNTDPAHPNEQPGGPFGTSMATRFNETHALEEGGGRKGGNRNLGSGGRAAAAHANVGSMPKGKKAKPERVADPSYEGDKPVPATQDSIQSDFIPAGSPAGGVRG